MQFKRRRRRHRRQNHIAFGKSPLKIAGDKRAQTRRLEVISVIVSGTQYVRPDHDATFDLRAECLFTRAGIHVHERGRVTGAMAVFYAVIPGKIRRRLGGANDIVCRHRIAYIGKRNVDRRCAAAFQPIEKPHERAPDALRKPVAEVFPRQADFHAGQIGGIQRLAAFERLPGIGRIALVGDRQYLKQAADIAHIRGNGADLIERRCKRDETVPRNPAIGRFQANTAAMAAWLPDRTAGIRPERRRHHACRNGGGAAARRPAGDILRGRRIARYAERRVFGARSHREFIKIGFSNDDRSRLAQRLHHRCIVGRHEICKHL